LGEGGKGTQETRKENPHVGEGDNPDKKERSQIFSGTRAAVKSITGGGARGLRKPLRQRTELKKRRRGVSRLG